jgi:glycosyltransferase involved in cell wall biosynthesis
VVSRRIAKFYRRDSVIVHPPCDTTRFRTVAETGDYYVVVSRFVPYKRLDLAVAAFTKLNIPLRIVGSGRQVKQLQRDAGNNVSFMGRVDDTELPDLLARARGFVMPGEEDFGIAPVEAMACGVPVIAYAAGGALDTQVDGMTGVLFSDQSVECLCAAVQRAEQLRFDPDKIRTHAAKFGISAFRDGMNRVVQDATSALDAENHPLRGSMKQPT